MVPVEVELGAELVLVGVVPVVVVLVLLVAAVLDCAVMENTEVAPVFGTIVVVAVAVGRRRSPARGAHKYSSSVRAVEHTSIRA